MSRENWILACEPFRLSLGKGERIEVRGLKLLVLPREPSP
jgi:hypothetical protein